MFKSSKLTESATGLRHLKSSSFRKAQEAPKKQQAQPNKNIRNNILKVTVYAYIFPLIYDMI